MLGERRSNSLFAPTAPAEPERKPEQTEVHDISFEERTGRSLFAETATAPRASELFFAPQEKGVTFAEALSQVQGYLSETYATLTVMLLLLPAHVIKKFTANIKCGLRLQVSS